MKPARSLITWGIVLASSFVASTLIYQQLQNPFETAQQTVITSTSRLVVVVIPGFPVESIVVGILVGLLALYVVHRRRTQENRIVDGAKRLLATYRR